MDGTAFALALGAAFCWGLALDVNKFCLGRLNAVTFNVIQYLVLAVGMTTLVLLTGVTLGSTWGVLMGVTFGVAWFVTGSLIFYYCIQCAPTHIVVPVSNTSAIWSVMFAALLLGESIGLAVPASLPFLVVGIFLMAPKSQPGAKSPRLAIVLSILLAAIFGLTQIARKSGLLAGIGPMTLLWIAGLTATPLLALVGLARGSFRGQRLDRYSFGVAATAGLGQIIGGTLFLTALSIEKASSLAPVTTATVPLGFLIAIPLLREKPTKKAMLGVALVFAGVLIATL